MQKEYAESLLVHFRRVEELKQRALKYPTYSLNERQLCDLELLLNRAFYPLKGFLKQEDYLCVLDNERLCDGTIWPIPIYLDVPKKVANKISIGDPLALLDSEGFLLAILHVEDKYKPNKKYEAEKIYGTSNENKHPSVFSLYHETNEYYLGGTIEGISLPIHYDFVELRKPPSEVHRFFSSMGWRNIIGFHTEKALHCAHKEMILRAAREVNASIFLNPVVGIPNPRDLDHFTMVRCYQAFVNHFPKNIITLALLPFASRKAGPKEALLQAIIRKNYGCTHFLVAPDHADPYMHSGDNSNLFYKMGEAQDKVKRYEKEIGIKMVPLTPMVYWEEEGKYIPEDEVKEGMKVKRLSSSELRKRLELDLEIPEWFSFKEVVEELKHTYPPRHKQGFTVFLTGLPGAGKSTIAKILYVKFMELRDRPVTLLDGDIVRKYLSSELNYSKEHREINVRRIGFVASEITKNGGIAICAPIAPYEESRRYNRELITRYGGYIEVYVATPFEVCAQRDRKGMYAKAKKGLIKNFTGVDDPYIPPKSPEITIDTTELTPQEAAQQIILYLEENGYIR